MQRKKKARKDLSAFAIVIARIELSLRHQKAYDRSALREELREVSLVHRYALQVRPYLDLAKTTAVLEGFRPYPVSFESWSLFLAQFLDDMPNNPPDVLEQPVYRWISGQVNREISAAKKRPAGGAQ
ncbi:MAG: hypothetical protein ABGZ35_18675 [Planctomycetaceae bacterium]